MAEIVLGIGTGHTPQMHTAVEDWAIRAELDEQDGVPLFYKGEQLKYAEVLAKRQAKDFDPDISLETGKQLLDRAYTVIDQLHELFVSADADVMVIFGNDQEEIFLDEINPAFAILGGAEFENQPRSDDQKSRLPPGIAIADPGHLPVERRMFPGHPELALHLVQQLTAQEFDVAWSTAQPRVELSKSSMSGMPHAYGFVYKQIMRDNVVPHVPVVTNTFFPPNQPTAKRSLALGRAVGEAIRSWDSDARVCVVCSGGLSHFLVDAEWDENFLENLKAGNLDDLATYPEGYFQAGSSECKSWLQIAGALEGTSLRPDIVDYFPLFRTKAGTGSSCGFFTWT